MACPASLNAGEKWKIGDKNNTSQAHSHQIPKADAWPQKVSLNATQSEGSGTYTPKDILLNPELVGFRGTLVAKEVISLSALEQIEIKVNMSLQFPMIHKSKIKSVQLCYGTRDAF